MHMSCTMLYSLLYYNLSLQVSALYTWSPPASQSDILFSIRLLT